MTTELNFDTTPPPSRSFERFLYALLCAATISWSGIMFWYPIQERVTQSQTALHLSLKKADNPPKPLEQAELAPEQAQAPDEIAPRDSSPAPTNAAEPTSDKRVIISSDDLLREAIDNFEAPSLSEETAGPYFDPRLNENLKDARARIPQAVESFHKKQEFFSLYGEHTIRKGNICTQDNTTMAKIAGVDHMYFTGVCGYKDEFKFEYKPGNRGYLIPSFNVSRDD